MRRRKGAKGKRRKGQLAEGKELWSKKPVEIMQSPLYLDSHPVS